MSFTDKTRSFRSVTTDVITSKSGDPIRVDALAGSGAIVSTVAPTVVTGNWTGTIASTTGSFTYSRNGNLVTLQFLGLPVTVEIAVLALAFDGVVPLAYRPSAAVRSTLAVTETAADLPAFIDITTAGVITITTTIAPQGINNISFPAFSVSYFIL